MCIDYEISNKFSKDAENNRGSQRNFLKDKVLNAVKKFQEIGIRTFATVVISDTNLDKKVLFFCLHCNG